MQSDSYMVTLYSIRAVFAQLQYIVRCIDHFYLMWDDSKVACQFHICYGSQVWNVRQINMDKQRCMAHPSDLLSKTNHANPGIVHQAFRQLGSVHPVCTGVDGRTRSTGTVVICHCYPACLRLRQALSICFFLFIFICIVQF